MTKKQALFKENDMPLKPGKKNIGRNIKEMEESGHSRAQSIAASLNEARKSGVKITKRRKNRYYTKNKAGHMGANPSGFLQLTEGLYRVSNKNSKTFEKEKAHIML